MLLNYGKVKVIGEKKTDGSRTDCSDDIENNLNIPN
jgi:hypothetical protein